LIQGEAFTLAAHVCNADPYSLITYNNSHLLYSYMHTHIFKVESKELEQELEHSMNGMSTVRACTLCKRVHHDAEIHLHRPTCRHADI